VRRGLVAGLLIVGLALALTAIAIGADPTAVPATATPVDVLEGGDLRSEGAGPGLVGNPLLILFAVVALGVATMGATVLLVRLTRRD
jgi:hypothetical protein